MNYFPNGVGLRSHPILRLKHKLDQIPKMRADVYTAAFAVSVVLVDATHRGQGSAEGMHVYFVGACPATSYPKAGKGRVPSLAPCK